MADTPDLKQVKLADIERDITLLLSISGWSDTEIDRLHKLQRHIIRLRLSAFPMNYVRS